MRFLTPSLPVAVLAVLGSTFACTLIVSVDRDDIPKGGGEADASAGGTGAGGGPGAGGEGGGGGAAAGGSPTAGGADGGPVEGGACTTGSNCPGVDTPCSRRVCNDGTCDVENTTEGTESTSNVAGDCKRVECDGNGAERTVDADDSQNDQNVCTTDTCAAGANVHTPVTPGTSCGTDLECNAAGECVGCSVADDCPGTDTACGTRTCTAGTCGSAFEPAGTPLPAGSQTAGDCKEVQCDGSGNEVTVNSDDLPDDGNDCTANFCNGGTPTNPVEGEGFPCSSSGGKVCDGAGACVACNIPEDCSGTDTECSTRTCISKQCGRNNAGLGIVIAAQAPGDCKQNECDGDGNVVPVTNDGDLPDDGNDCTSGACSSGTPSNPAKDAGDGCSSGGGAVCDGAGTCVECVVAGDCPGGPCVDNQCQ